MRKNIDLSNYDVQLLTIQAVKKNTKFKLYVQEVLHQKAHEIDFRTLPLIEKIIHFSKLSVPELRKLNANEHHLYQGKELTKIQLVFQLVFLMDAPDINK